MQIVTHPHPTLRHKSKTIKRVDAELRDIVDEMFELMYEAKGIGLAANQVNLPIRLFVVNLDSDPEKGEQMVFINPVISRPRGNEEAEEGCLSIPQVYAPVKRPKQVRVNAFNLKGEELEADVDGLLARVVQHETDHLDGVMFTDRLTETAQANTLGELEEFEIDYHSKQQTGQIPSNEEILAGLKEWEERYC